MRSTTDNPVDPLGNLGPAIKPKAAPAPDPVKVFEQQRDRPLIGNTSNAMDTIAETLKKSSLPTVSDGQESDWEGICARPVTFDFTAEEAAALKQAQKDIEDYMARLLGCI